MRCGRIVPILLAAWIQAGTSSGRAFGEERTNFPQPARDLFDKGQQLQKNGRHQEAIGAFESAIQQGMQAFPRVHLYRAGSFLSLKQYDTAIAQYTKFLNEFSLEDSCRY